MDRGKQARNARVQPCSRVPMDKENNVAPMRQAVKGTVPLAAARRAHGDPANNVGIMRQVVKTMGPVAAPRRALGDVNQLPTSHVQGSKIPSRRQPVFGVPDKQSAQPKVTVKMPAAAAIVPKNTVNAGSQAPAACKTRSKTPAKITPIVPAEYVEHDPDPQMASEYIFDIMAYLFKLEKKYPIPRRYLISSRVTKSMRSVLINWLAEVADSYKLMHETFQLTVALVDRYLVTSQSVNKERLQLVGMAAIFIASKYEEVSVMNLYDLEFMCDNAFTGEQICRLEQDMLTRLSFNLGRPTPIIFLRRFNKLAQATQLQHACSKYIIELAQMVYELCHVRPSELAAAACCLVLYLTAAHEQQPDDDNQIQPADIWTKKLTLLSCYSFADIEQTVYDLAAMLVQAKSWPHKTIISKYARSENEYASKCNYFNGAFLKELAVKSLELPPPAPRAS